MFDAPYIDRDEWRDQPVRHRYVHGGFAGTATRFSLYLPPVAAYQGRFFQHITPVPDSENLAQHATGEQDKIGFAIASGAYFVETNGGGASGRPGSDVDPTIAAYRANAAAAAYSRDVAVQMYGEHRPYGYAYGGSGGGYRTIGGAENTTGVWDGFVPYVIGSPMAIPSMFTVRMHAQRILRHRFDAVIDAVEPGGSGDIYADLDDEERAALREVTRMGFPPRSWFGYRTMGMHAFPVLYQSVRRADPSYFEEFWTEPGYLGSTSSPSLSRDRVQHHTAIAATITADRPAGYGLTIGHQPGQARGGVDTAWQGAAVESTVPVAVQLSSAPDAEILGADLVVMSGAATGARLGVLDLVDDIARFGPGDPAQLSQLQPGDEVEVDNTGYLAAQTYHRHQVPSADFAVWDQFREPDGKPAYPQRALILGPLFAAAAAGTVQTGKFDGKMIVVACLLDREAFPWQADWYRRKVRDHHGAATDDHFRLWYVDNALHGDDERQEHPTQTISYLGVLHQALRDLSQWVENGVEPPASTAYEVVDGQVLIAAEAAERAGVQPVVAVTANGAARAEVAVGEPVTLEAVAHAPAGGGQIVRIEWDLDGSGAFATPSEIRPGQRVATQHQHAFDAPGTYFVTARAIAHRDRDAVATYARLQNLARARVVVS